uniref:Dynein heavy chain n=1 Tax=Angiostrongylus cantonensis TaxID=6313 RepID=A0A158PAK5_ANGCA
MYNFNVTTIISIFRKVIAECQDRTSSRIETLMRSLQLAVFYHISRALFKADRLMFALSFIHGTLPKMFQPKEWELFTGVIIDEPQSSIKDISWIDPSRHVAIAKIQTHLPTLFHNLQLSDQGTWSDFSRTVDCENSMPPAIEQKITPFQKVLVIQATRPDRLYSAIQNFVLKTLSIPSVNPPSFDLSDVLAESSSREPVLLILAGGADPSQELEELASKTIGSHKYTAISMGQGQEQATIEAIHRAAVDGQWLCLCNVHLMLGIIPVIQKELAGVTPHEKFRLWMTTEEENKFPAIMLQQCLKITFEPPPGIRNNLLRTYSQIDDVKRSVLVNQIIFALAWLHALLQERRTFIPQAWTKFYEFSSADVRVARMLIEGLIKESRIDDFKARGRDVKAHPQPGADWEFIRGLLKFVIYGGRIENAFDGQVLDSYLSTLFTGEKITGRSGKMLSKGVELLAVDNTKEIQKYIATSIPSEDDPSLFGLPMNIRYSWQLTEAEETISRLRMAGKTIIGNERTRWNEACQPILQLWKRLCQGGDLHSRQTPDTWHDYWSGPRDPAEYLSTLIYKAKSVQELASCSEELDFRQTAVDFSKLFRPGRLLNALRQMTARTNACTMDMLRITSAWDASLLAPNITIKVNRVRRQPGLGNASVNISTALWMALFENVFIIM